MCHHHVRKCTTLNIPAVHIWIYYSCIPHTLVHLLYTHLYFTEFSTHHILLHTSVLLFITVHTTHSFFSHTYVTCQCSHKYCHIACIYLYTNCSWIHILCTVFIQTIFIPLYFISLHLIHRHPFCRWLQIQILNFNFDCKTNLHLFLVKLRLL